MTRDISGSAKKYEQIVDERVVTNHTLALQFTGEGRRVLELGCATGYVTAALKARGHHVVGVEIDPESAEITRAIADEVFVGDLDRVRLPDLVGEQRFDVVLAGDVLEHLREPVSALRDAVSLLDDDGFVVVSLPNVAFLDVRAALLHGDWTYRPDGLLDETHVRFFTRRTMFALARDAGLVVTGFHRVDRRPGTSNVALSDAPLDPLVRDLALLDPNASTYQFVAKFERPTDENRAEAEALDHRLSTEEDATTAQLRTLVDAHQREQAELVRSRQELIALQNGRLMRYSQFPRRVYRRLRRLLHLG